MALGAIEIVSMTRTQDYTTIKHNEDNKPVVNQMSIGQQQQKDIEQRAREVRKGDNAAWQNRKFDAKDKGKNEYTGDGGKKRDGNQSKEQVVVKGRQSFDMKI